MATLALESKPLARTDAVWWHVEGRNAQRNVFLWALMLRILFVLLTVAFADQLGDLSRDSIKYHKEGWEVAEQYRTGTNNWSLWVDHGWKQFVGLVYFLIGPHLLLIMFLNAFISAYSAAMVCRIAFLVTQNRAATLISGYTMAIFPSIVWYCSLPLKDATSVFALEAICLGILLLVVPKNRRGWIWIVTGLLLLVSLRYYLVPVCAGCVALCLLPIRLPTGLLGVLKWAATALLFGGGIFLAVSAAGIDVTQNQTFQYMDIDYLNNVRDGMNAGQGRMYDQDSQSQYGQGLLNDVYLFGKGVFFFIFSIDISNVGRARQLAAVPELLFFAICLPYLFIGVVKGWNRSPIRVLPLILFGLALIVIYSSATTNMGAMYRWRMQAVPFLIVLIVYGAQLIRMGPLSALLTAIEPRRSGGAT